MSCEHVLLTIYSYLVMLLLFFSLNPCNAIKDNLPCIPSSCGSIQNISYPFRLKTDPYNCGSKNYELECQNNNLTVLYLGSAKYYVHAINYNNFTVRLADSNVQKNNYSSIPLHFLSKYNFSHEDPPTIQFYKLPTDYIKELFTTLVFMSCPQPVNFPNETAAFFNIINVSSIFNAHLRRFTYVIVDPDDFFPIYIMDSCRIEMMSIISLLPKYLHNISYITIHDSLANGIELSWFQGCCENYPAENRCKLNDAVLKSSYCYQGDNFGTSLYDYELNCLEILYNLISSPGRYIPFRVPFVFYNLPLANCLLLIFVPLTYHTVLFIFGAPCVTFFLIYKWRRRHLSMHNSIEEFSQSYDDLMPVRYSYSDIKKITKGFKEKLGEGGYGLVYKGKLLSGRLVAIKVLSKSKANGQDFVSEVTSIGRIHHVNVVRLIGFCLEGSKRALVYDFMPNGSLEKCIFSEERHNAISNEKMYDISVGVARGIEYLHRGCDIQILHFDIKPHNILLDEDFNPKVSDFGLAKLYPTDNSIVALTAARGTIGYMAPELIYKNIGGISHKADVYSFGMLLLEMAGRRKNLNAFIEHSSQIYFPTWVHEQLSKGKAVELGDNTIEDENKIMKKMIIVGLCCIQLNPCDRPSMHEVLQMLEGDVECLKIPPKFALTPDEIPKVDVGININQISLTD